MPVLHTWHENRPTKDLIMPNPPSKHQLRRMARCVMGAGQFQARTPRVNAVRSRRHRPLPRRRLQAAGLYRWRTSPLDLALAALSGPLIGVALIWGIRLLAVPLTVLLGLWCAARVLLAVVRGLWLAWERGRGRY